MSTYRIEAPGSVAAALHEIAFAMRRRKCMDPLDRFTAAAGRICRLVPAEAASVCAACAQNLQKERRISRKRA
jgi:hypothetical protein